MDETHDNQSGIGGEHAGRMTLRDAADHWGITAKTLRRCIDKGKGSPDDRQCVLQHHQTLEFIAFHAYKAASKSGPKWYIDELSRSMIRPPDYEPDDDDEQQGRGDRLGQGDAGTRVQRMDSPDSLPTRVMSEEQAIAQVIDLVSRISENTSRAVTQRVGKGISKAFAAERERRRLLEDQIAADRAERRAFEERLASALEAVQEREELLRQIQDKSTAISQLEGRLYALQPPETPLEPPILPIQEEQPAAEEAPPRVPWYKRLFGG